MVGLPFGLTVPNSFAASAVMPCTPPVETPGTVAQAAGAVTTSVPIVLAITAALRFIVYMRSPCLVSARENTAARRE